MPWTLVWTCVQGPPGAGYRTWELLKWLVKLFLFYKMHRGFSKYDGWLLFFKQDNTLVLPNKEAALSERRKEKWATFTTLQNLHLKAPLSLLIVFTSLHKSTRIILHICFSNKVQQNGDAVTVSILKAMTKGYQHLPWLGKIPHSNSHTLSWGLGHPLCSEHLSHLAIQAHSKSWTI